MSERQCEVCGEVIYNNNMMGVCRRTEACRVEVNKRWNKIKNTRARRKSILEAIPWTIGLHPVPPRRRSRVERTIVRVYNRSG